MVMTNAGGGVKLPSGGEGAAGWSGSQERRVRLPASFSCLVRKDLDLP